MYRRLRAQPCAVPAFSSEFSTRSKSCCMASTARISVRDTCHRHSLVNPVACSQSSSCCTMLHVELHTTTSKSTNSVVMMERALEGTPATGAGSSCGSRVSGPETVRTARTRRRHSLSLSTACRRTPTLALLVRRLKLPIDHDERNDTGALAFVITATTQTCATSQTLFSWRVYMRRARRHHNTPRGVTSPQRLLVRAMLLVFKIVFELLFTQL